MNTIKKVTAIGHNVAIGEYAELYQYVKVELEVTETQLQKLKTIIQKDTEFNLLFIKPEEYTIADAAHMKDCWYGEEESSEYLYGNWTLE